MFLFSSKLFSVNNYVILLLGLVSVIGDVIVAHTKLHLFQAIFDNATHAIIGGLSWLYVCLNNWNFSRTQSLVEIAACTIIASFIDLDHFIAAKSLNLKDATSLDKRPPLHCSAFPFLLSFLLLLLSFILQSLVLKRLALIILTAFLTHHTRDATRRGFWFYPFGSTGAIPYFCYVGGTCLIPMFVCWLFKVVKISSTFINKETVI